MTPPKEFVEGLRRDFGDNLRIRWSVSRGEWQIEQKFRRGGAIGKRVREIDDNLIRVRDGYAFVLAVRPGDRMACTKCAREIRVPVMEFREAVCKTCGAKIRASYWPLGESLLQHLRYSDPNRDGHKRMLRDLEAAEQAKARQERRQQSNLAEDIAKEDFTQFFDIPSVGYTGKEFKGDH